MPIKIAVCNQKGGVGKTDLCVNLSSCLSFLGKRVLLIDMDPQAHATHYLTTTNPKVSTRDLLMEDEVMVGDVVEKTDVDNLDLVPSDISLSVAQVQLANDVNMQFKLKRKLKTLREYDYVFIDTPPSLGLLTVNAMTAADLVLIPIQAQYFAMYGVQRLLDTMDVIREDLNPGLTLGGLVMTIYDRRTNLSKEVEEAVRDTFKEKVFKTVIPINVRLAESPSHHKPIILYAPKSSGAKAYMNLAEEFMEWLKD